MPIHVSGAGLTPRFPSPPPRSGEPEDVLTDEAGIRTPAGLTLRVTPLVQEGEDVAQGAPVACLRDDPEVQFVAPMPARVATIKLLPGRKLSEIVLFGEAGGEVKCHDTRLANSEPGLRRLMQNAGIWTWLRRRPFGGMPAPAERPAAIVVMAADTRPFAPDPRRALEGREAFFRRGLDALSTLTDGPVCVVQKTGPVLYENDRSGGWLRVVNCGPRHPQGSAGIQIHRLYPAAIETPVWDVHAEDVASLGELLDTGTVPMLRLVSVAGQALREGRLVRTQPGADLRELTRRVVSRAAHILMSGSHLDGREARWLGARDRQVTVLPRHGSDRRPHWLVTALTRSARPEPIIPTSALTQAFAAELPAATFVRALSSGDDEMTMKLGALSLLEEDVALADYVLGGETRLAGLLRAMLDRVRTEFPA